MEKQLITRDRISINAPASRVWDALVNPEQTKKYMYGCSPDSAWIPGSEILWKGVFDGKEMTVVKGAIVSIEKGSYLAYTTFDPNSNIPDVPENYTTVTYSLEENGGETHLEVTQGDFAKVAEGEKRFKDVTSNGGWYSVLVQIKELAEQ